MTDKTCGTCANYVPFPLRRGEGLCFMTIDDDFPLFMRSYDACDGGVYRERTESSEQPTVKENGPNVAYLCDMSRCEDCSFPLCRHTTDIEHAKDFKRAHGGKYIQVDRTCRKVEKGTRYGFPKVVCSKCGYGLGDARWNHCPKCGMEIVDE